MTGHTDDDGELRTIPSEVVSLALRALTLANHGELPAAARVIERIGREHPPTGVVDACMTWVDALVAHVPEIEFGDALGFRNEDTGELGGADEVPPHVAWAGRYMLARARMDAETSVALVDSCTSDAEFAGNVWALLQMVSLAFTTSGKPLIVRGDHFPPRGGGRR